MVTLSEIASQLDIVGLLSLIPVLIGAALGLKSFKARRVLDLHKVRKQIVESTSLTLSEKTDKKLPDSVKKLLVPGRDEVETAIEAGAEILVPNKAFEPALYFSAGFVTLAMVGAIFAPTEGVATFFLGAAGVLLVTGTVFCFVKNRETMKERERVARR